MRKINKDYWFWLLLISGIGMIVLYKSGFSDFAGIEWLVLIIVCVPFGIRGFVKSIGNRNIA